MRITVNGTVLMNGPPGEFSKKPPEFVVESLKSGAKPQPWMKAAMVTMADAAIRQQDISLEVTTHASGWSLSVRSFIPPLKLTQAGKDAANAFSAGIRPT